MRQPELEPLSADLVRLLDAERRRSSPLEDMESRIRERLGRELLEMIPVQGAPASPTRTVHVPPVRPWRGRVPLSLALVCAGGLGGATLHALLRPPAGAEAPAIVSPAASPVERNERPPGPVAPAARDHVPGADQAASRRVAATPHRPPRSVALAPTTSSSRSEEQARPALGPDEELAAERALLEQARTALARGKPADALTLLARHAQTFPTGRLVEEREALVILSLEANHQTESARKMAAEFRQRHPHSMLLRAIDTALSPKP